MRIFQIDAFTDKLFSGNPAAVCLPQTWPDDTLMQSIAMENNLAETAFVVPAGEEFGIRWFTPTTEVDLCGHATLAAAYVLFNLLDHPHPVIRFQSPRSGLLLVEKQADMLYLDFPTDTITALEGQEWLIEDCIGVRPVEVFKGKTDFIAVVESESVLQDLRPDMAAIASLKGRGLVVTAPGNAVDFVSRFFAPQSGIDEDPVTGSAHTSLLPIWAKRLGKTRFLARQISARGGQLHCELIEDRCRIGGEARLYLSGEIRVDGAR